MKNANPVSILWRAAVLAAALSLTTGCGRSGAPVEQAAPKTAADYFVIEVGGKPLRLQLAVKLHERQRGLMERRDLKPDEGMLFVHETPQRLSFWMRNTPTPLDVGFFTADGVLKEVRPLHPYDETPVVSRDDRLQLAVEVNQGWFMANGVKPGAQLDMKALVEALRARGIEPREYGIR